MNFFKNNLIMKLFAPIGVVFIVMGIAITQYFSAQVTSNAKSSVLPTAVGMVQQFKTVRGYYTQNVIKKVLAESSLQPHFEHKNNPNRIPLPATLIHDLSDEFSKQGTVLRLYSEFPFPNRASRQLDPFATNAWKALKTDPKAAFSEIETINGDQVLRVALADTMSAQGCVDCHNSHPDTPKADWRLGDLRGVLEVQIPITSQLAAGQDLVNKLIMTMGVSLLIAAAILFVRFRTVVWLRLNQVSHALQSITQGEGGLNRKLEVGDEDEIGAIAKSFNEFVASLNRSLKQVTDETQALQLTSAPIAEIAERYGKGASEQQHESNQVATAMNEVVLTAQEVARLSTETAQNAQQAQELAQSGHDIVSDNLASVVQLVGDLQTASEAIDRIENDSQNIGGVLDVIRSIAEQTNLLALNAAIEAARAGDQGRGFAVVADEVRTLASRTQASTDDIQKMISQLQEGSKMAVDAIAKSRESMDQNKDNAEQVKQVIDDIYQAMQGIAALNAQIETAADEQASVNDEINRNITNIATVSQSNVKDVQGLQLSLEEINKAIDSVNGNLQGFTEH